MDNATLHPGCRCALPWAMCFCALPFLSACDLWFSATITDMNFRIRIFNFCTYSATITDMNFRIRIFNFCPSNCTPYEIIEPSLKD